MHGMTRLDNFHSAKTNHQAVPAGVFIVAEQQHLKELEQLESTISLLPAGLDEDLPLDMLGGARIVLLQVDPAIPASMNRLDLLQSHCPEAAIIASVEQVDIATSRALMRRGIDDLIGLPIQPEELLSALTEIAGKLARQPNVSADLAPVFVVMKGAGGCGATTVATHLAAALAANMGTDSRACVIDCDLQSGDAAAYLGCTPRLSLADLLDPQSAVDGELIRSVACRANELVDVIAAPHDIMPIEALVFDRLMEIINFAQQNYAMIVLDLPAALSNWAVSLAFAADRVVHVTTLSVTALRHTKRQLDFLKSMGLERNRIHVLANRCEKRLFKTIDAHAAADALGHPIIASITAEGPALGQAQDEGLLIDEVQRRTRFMKDVNAAAARLGEALDGAR